MRSIDDGVNWTAVAAAEANGWLSVAYGNGVWVATAESGGTNQVMRSVDDGASWIPVLATEANQWFSVAYGNGVWVAVSTDGANRVMRSTDGGASWTPVLATEANTWLSVAYGNGVWVAVSAGGANRVMRSTDEGVTWSAVAATEANSWLSVAYGNGVWVATAGSGANRVIRSVDAPASADPGVPGIFLAVNDVLVGSQVTGAPIYCGADSIQPNSIYTLSIQSVTDSALTRIILDSGSVNSRGHLAETVLLPEVNPGSYKIVMTGIHASGNLLVLTNFITIGANGGIVSVSPESQQPFLK